MEIEELRKLADSFFEWPTADRSQVTLTSALLFAQHVLRVIQQQAEPQRVTVAHMDALHKAIDHVAALQNNRLRFRSACEISGDKHPEYVRGYEAAMDAVCKAQRFTATDEAQPAPIPTSEVYLSGAEDDVLYKLFFFGPQNDGDLPSKSGMCGLISKGFAEKRYDTKYEQEPNILTMQGFLFARSRYGYDNTTMPPAPGGSDE